VAGSFKLKGGIGAGVSAPLAGGGDVRGDLSMVFLFAVLMFLNEAVEPLVGIGQ
jgi:hypothetical protein